MIIPRIRQDLIKTISARAGDWLEKIPVITGNQAGEVTAGDGKIWVRFANGQEAAVLNTLASLGFDRHITIGRLRSQPTIWRVAEIRENYLQPSTGGAIQSHHEQHEFPNQDTVWVNRKQVTSLNVLVSDAALFKVQVYGALVRTKNGIVMVENQELDLSSYVPASGAVYVGIETDEAGTLAINDGTPFLSPEAATLTDVPTPAMGKYTVAFVMLYDVMTTLTNDMIGLPVPLVIGRHEHDAVEVLLDRLGTTVDRDLQYMQAVIHSAGWVAGGEITDNGDGSIGVDAGIGLIRATDSELANLLFCDWAADASVALTNNDTNWFYIDYNAGTPIPVASTTEPTDYNTKIILAKIYRSGTELHINGTIRHTVGNHAGLMMQSMSETMPFAWVSGAAITEVGTRQFDITAGIWWNGLTRFVTAHFDGTTDTFNMYYRNGSGGWTESTGLTAINNTQYDDGSGTLATLTANRYGVHWVYIATDNDVHVVLGQGDYTAAQSLAATAPATIPPELETDSRIAAKIIIKKSDAAFTSLESFIGMDTASPSGGSTFDMAAEIHGASASAITNDDEIPFWESVANALRKITWANIKSTLQTDLSLSGTNSGDVTLAGTPNYITIAGQVITRALIALTHMADVATGTVFYRKTAGTGSPEVQTLATLKTDLGLTGTNSGDETATTIGNLVEGSTNKATPVDADRFGFWDSVADVLKYATWANIKSVLKTYFDALYAPISGITHTNMADRTRNIPFPALTDTVAVIGNADVHGTLSQDYHFHLANGVTTTIKNLAGIPVPQDVVAGGTCNFVFLWSSDAAGNNCNFTIVVREVGSNDAAHTNLAANTADYAAHASANNVKRSTLTMTAPTPGKSISFALIRNGAAGGDTNTGTVSLWGVFCEYTADM